LEANISYVVNAGNVFQKQLPTKRCVMTVLGINQLQKRRFVVLIVEKRLWSLLLIPKPRDVKLANMSMTNLGSENGRRI
jgi:hypothetical protein